MTQRILSMSCPDKLNSLTLLLYKKLLQLILEQLFLLIALVLPSYWLPLFISGFIAGCANSAMGIIILDALPMGIRF